MARGLASLEAINRVGKQMGLHAPLGGQESDQFIGGRFRIVRHRDHLDAVAGGNQRRFGH